MKYKEKALLHPVLFYLFSWFISLGSFFLGLQVGLEGFLIKDENILSELFVFVFVTNASIVLFSIRNKKRIVNSTIDFRWVVKPKILKIYAYAVLIISLVLIFQRGFDVAGNREMLVEEGLRRAVARERYTIFDTIRSLFLIIQLPLLIYSGWIFFKSYIKKEINFKFYYVFVLFSSILMTISGGGRAPIVSAIVNFAIGILMGFFSNERRSKRDLFKIVRLAFVFMLFFAIYVNIVAQARSERNGYFNQTKDAFTKLSYIGRFYGVMEYSIFHIAGYQLRRKDSVSEDLEYGQFTFQFITKFNIPVFSHILGKDLNVKEIFNLKSKDTQKGTAIAIANNLEMSSTTASVYLILFDDFGVYGTIISIIIFVYYTQMIYGRLFLNPIQSFWSLLLFLIIFYLWENTWMSHHLNSPFVNPYIYSALFLWLLNKIRL